MGFLSVFAFGTVWWIILSAAFFIWLLFAVTRETPVMATVAFLAYIAFAQFISGIQIFQAISHQPWLFLATAGAYLLLGVLWSFVKWWLHIRAETVSIRPLYEAEKARIIRDANTRFERTCTCPQQTVTIATGFPEFARERLPKVRDNTNRITLWVIYWPFSFIIALFEDLIRRLVRELVTALRRVYEWISERAMAVEK
jgi:hypothetical protein